MTTLPKTPLSPELKLVVACSWLAPVGQESAQKELIESLCAEVIDWKRFLALVQRHEVVGSVANRLAKFVSESVPSEVRASLKQQRLSAWSRALMLARELKALNELFLSSEVELMPLKGPVLASKLFNDPGFRPVLDIDLLVRREDLERAHGLLVAQGYQRVIPVSEVTPKQLEVLFAQCHHWVYRNVESNFSLELHWRIFRWSDGETQALWDRSHTYEWLGSPVRQPEHGLLLLSLCDHGSQHRYNRLKWLSDIVMLLATVEDWNWPEVLVTAATLDLEMPLAQAALLIDWLYDFEMPKALLQFAQSQPHAVRLAAEALDCLQDEDPTPYSPKRELAGPRHLLYWARRSARLAWYSTHLRKNVTLSSRIKPVLIGVSDFEAFPLPDRFFWLYYPLRPIFWILRCLRGR